jgi:hypothetical protein
VERGASLASAIVSQITIGCAQIRRQKRLERPRSEAENLPRDVRAAGVGFLYNIGAIGGGIAPFIVLSSNASLRLHDA